MSEAKDLENCWSKFNCLCIFVKLYTYLGLVLSYFANIPSLNYCYNIEEQSSGHKTFALFLMNVHKTVNIFKDLLKVGSFS